MISHFWFYPNLLLHEVTQEIIRLYISATHVGRAAAIDMNLGLFFTQIYHMALRLGINELYMDQFYGRF